MSKTTNLVSGNSTVDQLGALNLQGNIIPHTWYSHIKTDSGMVDMTAIIILSEIVYWYRPRVIRHEETGAVLGYKKRFKADLLQRSYDSFAKQFGFTKRQVSDAIKRLEKKGLIRREFRTIDMGGIVASNVLFIDVDADKVTEITTSIHGATAGLSLINVTPPTQEGHTNTETTPETSTDINNPPNPQRGDEHGNQKKTTRKTAVTLKTFSDECKAKGEGVVSGYKPLLDHVENSGLPMEFVQLAWDKFKKEFEPGGVNEKRRQKDWRRHFYNYVTKGYYKLWWAEDTGNGLEYKLTSIGLQTKQAIQNSKGGGNG